MTWMYRHYCVTTLCLLSIGMVYFGGCYMYNRDTLNHNIDHQIMGTESKSLPEQPHVVNTEVCPVVHIAMVVSGNIEGYHIYLAIKSLLVHRTTKLHFHFIADSRAETVLKTLLNSWLVPGISHDYYDLNQAWKTVFESYKAPHCFGNLLLKLNLHLILPESINGAIIIEPKSVVNTDFVHLWSVTMSCPSHMITLCNKECIYCCHCKQPVNSNQLLWGALGLNLNLMRSSPSGSVLQQAVKSVQNCRSDAAKNIHHLVQTVKVLCEIPTSSNTTFTNSSQVDCFQQVSYSNNCIGKKTTDQESVCKHVKEYDGNLLRYKEMMYCPKGMTQVVTNPPPDKELCKHFSWERVTKRRELLFLMGHSYNSNDSYDVTLVNHVNFDRLHLIERSLINWHGPVSLAIQVNDTEMVTVVDFILNSTILRERTNMTYHLLFRIGPSYPINALREIGHRHVTTPYVVYYDIDLVSSYNIHETMKQSMMKFKDQQKVAFVIASLEVDTVDFVIPRNKSEVADLMAQDVLRQFHGKSFFRGQGQTDYKKWRTATEPYYIKWRDMYEPYCLLPTSVFSFDPLFVNRFHDKGSHIVQLYMSGFKFLVLHDCFTVHLPHEINTQNQNSMQKCSKKWYTDWIKNKKKETNYKGKDVPNFFLARK